MGLTTRSEELRQKRRRGRPASTRVVTSVVVLVAASLGSVLVGAGAPPGAAEAVVTWTIVPGFHGTQIQSILQLDDNGFAIGAPPATGLASLVFDPRTGTSGPVEVEGIPQSIRDLSNRDEVVGDPSGFQDDPKGYYKDLRSGLVKTFADPEGVAARALRVNDVGVVIGTYGPNSEDARSWFWHAGDAEATTIPNPPGARFVAADVNDSGLIAGIAIGAGSSSFGLIYDSETGMFTDLGPSISYVSQITNSGFVLGQVSGTSDTMFWSPNDRQQHVVHATAARMSENGLILLQNASGLAGTAHALLSTTTGAVIPLHAPQVSTVIFVGDINRSGVSVGCVRDATGVMRPALWDETGAPTDLGLPPAATRACGTTLNDAGQVAAQVDLVGAPETSAIATVHLGPTPTTTTTSTPGASTTTTPGASTTSTAPGEVPLATAVDQGSPAAESGGTTVATTSPVAQAVGAAPSLTG